MNYISNTLFNIKAFETGNHTIYEIEVLNFIENQEWLKMYEGVFKKSSKSDYRFLINNMKGYDGLDHNGFTQLVDLCKRYNIDEMKVAVVTKDSLRINLTKLFLIIAEDFKYNFNIEVFGIKGKAMDWLTQD